MAGNQGQPGRRAGVAGHADATHSGFRRDRAAVAAHVHREGVPRLLDVRHPRSRLAAHRRRLEAGAAAHRLRDERARPVGGGQAQEIGAHDRRRHRQVPSARRLRRVRSDGADGAVVLVSLPARRRAGQLRFARRAEVVRGDALHRVAPHSLRGAVAVGAGAGHGRLAAELRRHARRAGASPGACAERAAQRRHRHCRRHGHRHSAAQPARSRERLRAAAGRAGEHARRPVQEDQRTGLPDGRRDHHARGRDPADVQERQRLDPRARRVRDRGRRDRHHAAALPGVRQPRAGADSGAAPGQEAADGRDLPRRVRSRASDAHRHRAALESRRHRAADGAPVRHDGPGAHPPRQLQHHRPGRQAEGDGPEGAAGGMAAVPLRHRHQAHQLAPGESACAAAHPRRPARGLPEPRRGDQDHPPRGRAEAGADEALQAERHPGRGDSRDQAAPSREARRDEDQGRAGRAQGGRGRARQDREEQGAPEEADPRRAARRRGRFRRRSPEPHRRARRRTGDRRDRAGHERAGDGRVVAAWLGARREGARSRSADALVQDGRFVPGRGTWPQHAARSVSGQHRPCLQPDRAFAAVGARAGRAAVRATRSAGRRDVCRRADRRARRQVGDRVGCRLRLRRQTR